MLFLSRESLANCLCTVQTTRLAFKLVVPTPVANQDTSRSSSDHEDTAEEALKLELLDASATLTIQSKALPRLVIQSVYDKQDGEEGQRLGTRVQGESGRSLRLRIFEGQIPPLTVREAGEQEQQQQQELEDPTEQTLRQWQFVSPQDKQPHEDTTESVQTEKTARGVEINDDQPQPDDPNATECVKEESRVDEILATNSKGRATFEGLLLPSTTLLGDYYLMCESLSSDAIPPVYLPLFLTL